MSKGGLTPELFEREMTIARAAFDVIQSNETTLLLDLDNDEAFAQYMRVLPVVERDFGFANIETWASKSGNRHVRLTLRAGLPFAERVALQAALGSDGVKEVLSLKRLQNGCVEPSALFRPRAPSKEN